MIGTKHTGKCLYSLASHRVFFNVPLAPSVFVPPTYVRFLAETVLLTVCASRQAPLCCTSPSSSCYLSLATLDGNSLLFVSVTGFSTSVAQPHPQPLTSVDSQSYQGLSTVLVRSEAHRSRQHQLAAQDTGNTEALGSPPFPNLGFRDARVLPINGPLASQLLQ